LDYIPKEVQPYFVKRICFYGPESTGKSTAAVRMAEHYHTLSVPEVAREMLVTNNFTIDDIIRIGKAQTERVLECTRLANKLLFCDTDVIVTQIYSRHYLGVVPEICFEFERQVKYDKYFFFDIDVPWVEDRIADRNTNGNIDVEEEVFVVLHLPFELKQNFRNDSQIMSRIDCV